MKGKLVVHSQCAACSLNFVLIIVLVIGIQVQNISINMNSLHLNIVNTSEIIFCYFKLRAVVDRDPLILRTVLVTLVDSNYIVMLLWNS